MKIRDMQTQESPNEQKELSSVVTELINEQPKMQLKVRSVLTSHLSKGGSIINNKTYEMSFRNKQETDRFIVTVGKD